VKLGGVTMTAHLTPGHSKGCTTWTTAVEEGGTRHDVVFFCSQRVNDRVPLTDNPKYPTLAEDFAASFDKLKTLPCDVFLASHAFMFNLEPKLAKWKENPQQNPFIDPQGCRDYVTDWEYEFRYKLQQERLAKQAK
jgi:metallo-beta-lactamase class B